MASTVLWEHASRYEPEAISASLARDFVARHLAEHRLAYLVEDIEVVVSDLVTNSIRDAAVPVAVSLEQMYFGVLLIVGIASGAGSEAAPTGATETIEPETWDGGLRLVELLSNEWGVDAGGADVAAATWATFRIEPMLMTASSGHR